MPDRAAIARLAPYALMLALGAIEPLTHLWILYAPPEGSVPSGLHTGDSGHHLAAMDSFGNGFQSPFATCKAEDGGAGIRYFAVPIFLLYGVAGELGRLAGLPPFLWLGLLNGFGGFLLLWSVYRFLRRIASGEARAAFYLYALGGGLGGMAFLAAWIGGGTASPEFEAWFYRFARYELIEGQHLSPVLLMPRFYYTFPLALGFAALTALVETDRCRCPGHLFFTCFLLFLTASINLRLGPLFWGFGAAYLMLGSHNALRYRAGLALGTLGAVAGGAAVFLWVLGFHPSYAENVGAVTRQCVLLLPLLYATAFHWPAIATALLHAAPTLPRSLRAAVVGACGYLAVYVLIYVGHQAWYGNVWQGGDLPAAILASDGALLAVIPSALAGFWWQPRPAAANTTSPAVLWMAVAFIALLAVSVSAWGQGWFLRFAPQRCMVLLGVPLALLAASGLRAWPAPARRIGFGLLIGAGVLSQAVAALYFQGPLGRVPGAGPFAHLHYAHVTEADARLLQQLPPGIVAVPPWSPIAFGEIIARHGAYRVVGGPGALNLGDQPFGPLQEAVNHFFSAEAGDTSRRAFVAAWCVEYLYLPDTCPVDGAVLAAFRDADWLNLISQEGRGAIFKVQPPRP